MKIAEEKALPGGRTEGGFCMKGLLLKEAYMVKTHGRSYLIFLIIFMGVGLVSNGQSMFYLLYPALLIGMMPVSLLSYDETEHWNITCDTLPVTRADYVTAKYATGFILNIAMILLYLIVFGIRSLTAPGLTADDIFSLLSVTAVLSFLVPSLAMPIIFRLGAEKGRLVYLFIIGITAAVFTMFFVGMDSSVLQSDFLIALPVRILMPLAALVLFLISRYISILFYKNRVF